MAFGDSGIKDNFNRTDEGPPPSASWTDIYNGCQVVSNEVRSNVLSDDNITVYTTSYNDPQETYITFRGWTVAGYIIVFARAQQTGSISTIDGYGVGVENVSGSNNDIQKIYRADNGGLTQLGSDIALSVDLVDGDKSGISTDGTTIKAWFDDGGAGWVEKGSQTDSTYTGSGEPALDLKASSGHTTADDFGGGDFTEGATGKSNPLSGPLGGPLAGVL